MCDYWTLGLVVATTLEPLNQSLITLPSANIILNSSLRKIFCVYVIYILLKLDVIFCMNVRSLTDIGILEGILLLILHYSSNLTLVLFPCLKHHSFIINLALYFSLFSSFLFLLFFSLSFFMLFQSACM